MIYITDVSEVGLAVDVCLELEFDRMSAEGVLVYESTNIEWQP